MLLLYLSEGTHRLIEVSRYLGSLPFCVFALVSTYSQVYFKPKLLRNC